VAVRPELPALAACGWHPARLTRLGAVGEAGLEISQARKVDEAAHLSVGDSRSVDTVNAQGQQKYAQAEIEGSPVVP
jgi:hypothetical protein